MSGQMNAIFNHETKLDISCSHSPSNPPSSLLCKYSVTSLGLSGSWHSRCVVCVLDSPKPTDAPQPVQRQLAACASFRWDNGSTVSLLPPPLLCRLQGPPVHCTVLYDSTGPD